MTGDLIEDNIFRLLPMLKPFKNLSTHYPIYMVIGNHDFEYNHPDNVISSFSLLGIEVLINSSIFIGSQFNVKALILQVLVILLQDEKNYHIDIIILMLKKL